MVCPGDLIGLPSFFLESPLGKLEAEEDFLLPLDGGPQRATNRELVETDGTGGSVSDVSMLCSSRDNMTSDTLVAFYQVDLKCNILCAEKLNGQGRKCQGPRCG